jgi:hypothetical protein
MRSGNNGRSSSKQLFTVYFQQLTGDKERRVERRILHRLAPGDKRLTSRTPDLCTSLAQRQDDNSSIRTVSEFSKSLRSFSYLWRHSPLKTLAKNARTRDELGGPAATRKSRQVLPSDSRLCSVPTGRNRCPLVGHRDRSITEQFGTGRGNCSLGKEMTCAPNSLRRSQMELIASSVLQIALFEGRSSSSTTSSSLESVGTDSERGSLAL